MNWRAVLAFLLPMGITQSPIKSDEEVALFPTFGQREPGATYWTVTIHGWIHEPERDSLVRGAVLGAFRKALGLEEGEEASALFTERARAFLVDNERGKRVPIRLGEAVHRIGPSAANGHFEGPARIPSDEASRLADGRGWITIRAVTAPGDDRAFVGRIQLIDGEGLSVISDIDDTIKISEVRDRKALLANTFTRPFRAVPDMAARYRSWADRGAAFHYVSSSPWQLHRPLTEFLRAEGFPEGSLHLRDFRWKDSSFLDLFQGPERTKLEAIEPILRAFPKRRFLLVGDSGEKDPEIYAGLAARYPDQIERILIRDVSDDGAGADAERYRNMPAGRWRLFRDASELIDP